jgi:pimeloyl-ACP methyl ester carboxylesterase
MATIVHKGVQLVYDDQGAGNPAFVFIHGWTCDRSFFAPQAEHFARHHRVISLDLRGHGESDKPQGAYAISAYVDDIAHVIGELKLGKVVAVGHSMGGITVLEPGATHSDKVAAIVMVDPAPFVFPPSSRRESKAWWGPSKAATTIRGGSSSRTISSCPLPTRRSWLGCCKS